MIGRADLDLLICPTCHGRVSFDGYTRRSFLWQGRLTCVSCQAVWSVREGLCHLFEEHALTFKERMMKLTYDRFARFHDPLVRLVFPLLKPETAADTRDRYLRKLKLMSLRRRADGAPVRIREVGVGSGDDLAAIERHVPSDVPVEIWGVDVSIGMVRELLPKLDLPGHPRAKILMADAHALPFPDASFDRVYHVGAANSYRDPKAALTEMARVAKPGSPIVVVDEWLDRAQPPRLRDRVIFQMLTSYDWNLPHPTSFVPATAKDVVMEQLNPVFYCLSFTA